MKNALWSHVAHITALAIVMIITATFSDAFASESETCTTEKETCLQGAETRLINGVKVYRDCWQYETVKNCVSSDNADYCAPLKNNAACHEESTTCLESPSPGICTVSESVYHCESPVDPVPDGVVASDVITEVTDVFETDRYCPHNTDPDCNVQMNVCTAPDETRVVDGIEVTLPCWEMSTDFSCQVTPENPSCDLLHQAGCTLQTSDQQSTVESVTTNTESETRYYACRDDITVPSHDDIVFDERFAVIDSIAEKDSTCETNCEITNRTCNETHPLFAEVCVEESLTRVCEGSTDPTSCSPLTDIGCRLKTNESIASTDSLSENGTSQDYVCQSELTPLPENIIEVSRNEIYVGMTEDSDCPSTLPDSEQWQSRSATLISKAESTARAQCSVSSKSCLEGPETRIVNGTPVYKDCWRYEIQYSCTNPDTVNGCEGLADDKDCAVETKTCIAGNEHNCSLWTYTYRCQVRNEQIIEEEHCTESICQHGLCTPTDDAPNTNLTDTIAKLEIARQAAVYGDYDGLRFFSGTAETCRNKLGGVSCCKGKVRASYSNENALGASYIFASQIAKETVKTLGSPYVNDILMSHDTMASVMTKLYGEAAMKAYSPSLSYYGLSVSYASGSLQFSFDPWTFFAMVAIDVATDYLSCTQEEQALQLKRGSESCLYVGSVCTEFNLGRCQEKTESYCCYNSRLARLVQEAAHEQLGLSWGDITAADCRGLTAYEFSQLDLSTIDIDELRAMIGEQRIGTVDSDKALTRAKNRAETLKTDPYKSMPTKEAVCANSDC